MLPHEIEPFADHHINALKGLVGLVHSTDHDPVQLTHEQVEDLCRKLDDAAQALVRFKICMADEVAQKQNMIIKYQLCRAEHH